MFAIDCPRHRTRILLGTRAIDALVPTADGVALHWRCHCGAQGVLPTGRPSNARPHPSALSAA